MVANVIFDIMTKEQEMADFSSYFAVRDKKIEDAAAEVVVEEEKPKRKFNRDNKGGRNNRGDRKAPRAPKNNEGGEH